MPLWQSFSLVDSSRNLAGIGSVERVSECEVRSYLSFKFEKDFLDDLPLIAVKVQLLCRTCLLKGGMLEESLQISRELLSTGKLEATVMFERILRSKEPRSN